MAFTFHHSADAPWVDVLEALFTAGYLLIATYPIRSDETKGATDAFRAHLLPAGRRPSTEWERMGVRRATPTVDPQRAGGSTAAGDTGSGEASWRRKLAPRHRDVVRRFFSTGD